MAHPARKAGEEADRMIAEQKRLREEQQAAVAIMAAKATEELTAPPAVVDPAPEQPANDAGVVVEKPEGVNAQSAGSAPAANPDLTLIRDELEKANQRWKVLQGMINRKDEEINTLRTLLAQVGEQSKPNADSTHQRAQAEGVTKQDVDDFGQDLIDLVHKVARLVVSQQISEMDAKFTAELSKVGKVATVATESSSKTAKQLFLDNLAKRVPNWKVINEDPAFLTWLEEVDELSGQKLIGLLTEAYNQMDVVRTARFFERFIEASKPVAPAVVPPAAAADPASQVTPSRSTTSAPSASAGQKKFWTKQDIQQLYSDQRNNRISKEEFLKQERDLFAASRDNRVEV